MGKKRRSFADALGRKLHPLAVVLIFLTLVVVLGIIFKSIFGAAIFVGIFAFFFFMSAVSDRVEAWRGRKSRQTVLSRRTVIIVFSVVALGYVTMCGSAGAWELILALPLGLAACFIARGLFNALWSLVVAPLIFWVLELCGCGFPSPHDSDGKPNQSPTKR